MSKQNNSIYHINLTLDDPHAKEITEKVNTYYGRVFTRPELFHLFVATHIDPTWPYAGSSFVPPKSWTCGVCDGKVWMTPTVIGYLPDLKVIAKRFELTLHINSIRSEKACMGKKLKVGAGNLRKGAETLTGFDSAPKGQIYIAHNYLGDAQFVMVPRFISTKV